MRSNVRTWKPLSLLSHTLWRDTYTAGFGQPPWPLAMLLGPAEENTRCCCYVLPVHLLFDTVTLGSHYGVTDSRLLDAPPNTLLLLLVSIPSFLSGGALRIRVHLSRPISLWHFDRYTVFPTVGTPCEAPCSTLLGVKRFLYF